jgi:hypothetical protein
MRLRAALLLVGLVAVGCAHGPTQTQLGTRTPALWVPHIPQGDPVGASWRYSGRGKCGHAALAMVARAFHVRDDLSDAGLVDEMARLAGSDYALSNVHFRQIARQEGWGFVGDWSTDGGWIRQRLGEGSVVVIAGNVHALPWHRPGPPNGHFVTIAAALPDGRFVVHDPGSDGPRIATQADLEAFMRTKGGKPGGAFAFSRPR